MESDWQRLRKETKRHYMRDLAEYSAKQKASAAEVRASIHLYSLPYIIHHQSSSINHHLHHHHHCPYWSSMSKVEIDSFSDRARRPQDLLLQHESISEPEEPDLELLKTQFESHQHYHSLFIAHQLFNKTEQTILDTMKELRAVAAAVDKRQVSSLSLQHHRPTTCCSYLLCLID